MKKAVVILAAASLVFTGLPMTTFAHGYNGNNAKTYALCTVADCHLHDGTVCMPHSANDGHGYHRANRKGGCFR